MGGNRMKLKEQLSTLADNIKTYWRRPPEGKYMPFKEVAAYSVGGIGSIQISLVYDVHFRKVVFSFSHTK